jgi:hypothetical protein
MNPLYAIWHPVYASVDLKDATVTVNGVTIKVGEGNITWTEHNPMTYVLDRGELDDVKKGDEQPVDVKLDAMWEIMTSTGVANLEDAIKGTGTDSTSSDPDTCRPFACDIVVALAPDCGSNMNYTLADFRWETMDHDLKAATISTTGKCNIKEVTRSLGT